MRLRSCRCAAAHARAAPLQVRINTKMVYNQQKFNLLREARPRCRCAERIRYTFGSARVHVL
jgi:hypothetical protein